MKNRCAFLNKDGRQCKKEGKKKYNYHGESELYSDIYDENKAHWVRVFFCEKHNIN